MKRLSMLGIAIGMLLAPAHPALALSQVPAIPEPGALGLFALGVAATVVGVRYLRRR